jgi:hypothetical protein
VGVGAVAGTADRADVLEILRGRLQEQYSVTLDRCIGIGDRVIVSMRFSSTEADPTDERPLQSRRMYLVGRYAAIVTTRDGRVVRVDEQPSLAAALEAARCRRRSAVTLASQASGASKRNNRRQKVVYQVQSGYLVHDWRVNR